MKHKKMLLAKLALFSFGCGLFIVFFFVRNYLWIIPSILYVFIAYWYFKEIIKLEKKYITVSASTRVIGPAPKEHVRRAICESLANSMYRKDLVTFTDNVTSHGEHIIDCELVIAVNEGIDLELNKELESI